MDKNEQLEKLAEEMYDFACANRLEKKGNKWVRVGNPREIGCPFKDLMEPVKRFYRDLAQFCLDKMEPLEVKLNEFYKKERQEVLRDRQREIGDKCKFCGNILTQEDLDYEGGLAGVCKDCN